MIFTSAPLCSDPSNWNQPPHAQDQAGSYCSGATVADNNVIQLPPDFTLASNSGSNTIVTDATSLTANSLHLNKSPIPESNLKCPRCESTNTKFCYFNNYSLSQPRHFCRACRRYWTRGGTLRNVPVGGSRRNCKRTKVSSSNSKSKRAGSKALPVIRQITTSSLSSDLGATNVQLGVPEMPMHWKLPLFPFTIGTLETALPTEMHASNHLGLNSRYDKLLCGSNDATGGVISTSPGNKNYSEFQSGFSNVNYSSHGNIFP